MNQAQDRLEKLKNQSLVTGIDFIYVYPSQALLDIYFLRPPSTLNNPLFGALTPNDLQIYDPSGTAPDIPVSAISWSTTIDGHEILSLTTSPPTGRFALYNLLIKDDRVDIYYNDVPFNFKANCETDLDCAPPEHECPPEDPIDIPIDYRARDFWSYRNALFEFASLRYPGWQDRFAADAGVMLAEIMSAVGDEMAYYQDRIGREAYLETATQRRSVRHHARMVDYNLQDGLGSFAWLDITVKENDAGNIDAGTAFWSAGKNGVRTDFEAGRGLNDSVTYNVDFLRNQHSAYRWDEDQLCLPVGATEMYIGGHQQANLLFDDFAGTKPGKWVLLKTLPENPAEPIRSHMVRLTTVTDTSDVVFGLPITHIAWEEDQALPFEMDMTVLVVRGNIIPATAGRTYRSYLVIGARPEDLDQPGGDELITLARNEGREIHRAIERSGRDTTTAYLHTLALSEQQGLVWLDRSKLESGIKETDIQPEIQLDELEFINPAWQPANETWEYKSSLVGVNSSQSEDTHFTLDDGSWRRVVGYQRTGGEIIHEDYASDKGVTARFGDGEFGLIPAEKTVFLVTYRLGGGKSSNVTEGSITNFDQEDPALGFIKSISNPFNAIDGKDPETHDEVRQSAPEAFRTISYRAVRPEDYAEAAERLPWVQKAGATFRWTGSWTTAFVTPDPLHAVAITDEWEQDLRNQLNRFRQAGREAHSLKPKYADIDMYIEVCVSPDAYPGEVKERVLLALFGKKGVIKREGYFSPDRFTFGVSLERSTLEAVIQKVPGVKAVESIIFRRRGFFDWKNFDELYYDPGVATIIRIENDLQHPERGILKIHTHGGA